MVPQHGLPKRLRLARLCRLIGYECNWKSKAVMQTSKRVFYDVARDEHWP
jgi:hypothetical protein